ncbi:DUF2225 domain-containing protein [Cellulosilyticum sp. I15G10I2]|uniref:DUF2225 domain-containing protein n=1 Tax=Cellulosilyticum sp. I15G10I2 TaxID=1892843 RepID=UPI00085BC942|nr:DUF2225 domain-containing protein [Cellulosilyticum sp. I15G10I2]
MNIEDTQEAFKNALYDKSYTCTVCNRPFTAKTVKVGKNQVISVDSDLYTRYSVVNPILYDALVCPNCGYAAVTKSFDTLLPKQKEWIKTQICDNYKKINYSEYTTIQESIHKHKMALLTCITKKGKTGEQAYIALHIAWLYRDLGDEPNEISFLQRAYEGFDEALSTERFPIFGLDDTTVMYILADIGYRLGNFDSAKKYLSTVITSPGISSRIKDRALELKEKVMQHH